jgi:tetratricopeptide (TPR) repeat protein
MSRIFSCLKYGFCLLLCFVLFSPRGTAQNFSQQFDALFLKEQPDTVQVRTLLRLWQRTSPEDPQLYVAAFNFYFIRSQHQVVVLEQAPLGDSSYTVKDSGGNPRGYLNPHIDYDPQRLRAAFEWIDNGIRRFPDRLDMWMGKAHALRQTENYDSFLIVMQRVLNRSVDNKNQWLWNNDKRLESGRDFLLGRMQAYLRGFYESERVDLMPVMSKLGEAVIRVYPEEVEVLSMTAVSLLLQKQYAKAIAYLRRAERIRPRDVVVLNNLAEAYRESGDKDASKRYLKLVESYGTADEKAAAKKNRKSLRRE